jgi:hypothetical protein
MACSDYHAGSSVEVPHSKGNQRSRRGLVNKFDRNLQCNERICSELSKLVGIMARIVSNDNPFRGNFGTFAVNMLGEALGSLNDRQAVHVEKASSHAAPQARGAEFNP